MKKLIPMILVALAATGCNLLVVEERPCESAWWLRNATGLTLMVTPPPFGATGGLTLAPGQSVRLYSRSEYGDAGYFGMMMILWRGRTDEEVAFTIRSAEGAVIKRWEYRDKDDYSPLYYDSHQEVGSFFDEDAWTKTPVVEADRKRRREWTFEITPGHIQPTQEL